VFPAAKDVVKLTVSNGMTLLDRPKIEEFLASASELRRGWAYTWHTYPTPQATVLVHGASGAYICRVDLGPNWLGSDCGEPKAGAHGRPLVNLSKEQARTFRDLVGGKWRVV